MSTQITPHVTLANLTYHPTAIKRGIVNIPPDDLLVNMIRLCLEVVEPIHDLLKTRIQFLSGYRSQELQAALIRQGRTGPHQDGLALDFITPDMPISQAFDEIASSEIPFDTLTWAWNRLGNNWIEVTAPPAGQKPQHLCKRNVRQTERVFLA